MRRRTCLRSWLRDFVGPGEDEGRTHSHKHGSFQPLGLFPPKRVSHPKLDSVVGRNDSRGGCAQHPPNEQKTCQFIPSSKLFKPFPSAKKSSWCAARGRSRRGSMLKAYAVPDGAATTHGTVQQRRRGRCSNDARTAQHTRTTQQSRTMQQPRAHDAARCVCCCSVWCYLPSL